MSAKTMTEEECYLAALLMDESGIDLAEFCWIDEEQADNCYRLWDFQWPLYRSKETYQIDYMGRSLGKTVGIIMRSCAFIFNYPGQELLIGAPELNHLRPVVDKIEHQLLARRITREMLPRQRGNGINHQPQFQAHFVNNARIVSRLPNRDGRGFKGQHPLKIELDEGQDVPDNGWIELIETMKAASPGASWRVHGVSRGVRDRYYKYTMQQDPDIPFYVHRYMAMHRPSWGPDERRNKIAIYGGTEDNVDYRRNVYGEHGDASATLFVLHRLMACVRVNESPWASQYNDDVYAQIKINDELLKASGAPIETFLQFPGEHLDEKYVNYWAGVDVGFTRDPSEILIWGEIEQAKGKEPLLRLLARIHLMRISADDQAQAIRAVFGFYGPRLRRLTLDKTGVGLPLWQALDPEAVGTHMDLRRTPEHISRRIQGYGFSQKVAVEFDDRELEGDEKPEDAVIEKNVVSFAAEQLRKYVDTSRLELPFDSELLSEWQGQEVQYVRDEGAAAGIKTRMVGGSLHTLDAAFMMIAGKELMAIEELLKTKPAPAQAPVLARFGV